MPSRREFLRASGMAALGLAAAGRGVGGAPGSPTSPPGDSPAPSGSSPPRAGEPASAPRHVTLFLCGDVMTGRGIDQILARPSDPRIHEPWAASALDYVRLAERAHGPIPRGVDPAYVWGDALAELDRAAPDVRIVNLETAVTTSDDWEDKGINYRMHPANVACLTAAGIDGCTLANNHVLDWGRGGLIETVDALRRAGLATAGAGESLSQAAAPAVFEIGAESGGRAAPRRAGQALPEGPGSRASAARPEAADPPVGDAPGGAPGRRVLCFSWGATTSGVPRHWEAGPNRPGVALLPDLSPATATRLAETVHTARRPDDLVVVSLHWGGNWGYEILPEERRFARALVDQGAADLVHGHSSHHPKAIEVHRGRPILYGCGDFLNDYEGIGGREEYRSELVLGYLATFDPATRRLAGFDMMPFRLRRFRLERAAPDEAAWLRGRIDRECRPFGGRVGAGSEGRLRLDWS